MRQVLVSSQVPFCAPIHLDSRLLCRLSYSPKHSFCSTLSFNVQIFLSPIAISILQCMELFLPYGWFGSLYPTQSVQSLAGENGHLSIFPDITCSTCFTLEVGGTICAEWRCLVVEFASKAVSYAIAGSSSY